MYPPTPLPPPEVNQFQHVFQNQLTVYLPSLLGALAILLGGWFVALALSAVTRKGLASLKTNQRINTQTETPFDYEKLAGRIVFWAVLLLALIGMFSILNVDGVSGPLSTLANTVMLYLPRLLMALLLALLAWIVATIVRSLVNRALNATRLDETLSASAGMEPVSKNMGNVAYWLVLLLFLPAIVGVLQIEGLMQPLANMTNQFLEMLPRLFAASMIGLIGYVIAKVVRGLVSNLLVSTGVDKFSANNEQTRGLQLSKLGGTLAFVLVIVPTLIAALDALRIPSISTPLTRMLDVFLQAIPNILAAAAILLLAWFIGRFVAELVSKLLANLGFDKVPERLGLGHAFAANTTAPVVAPSETVAQPAAQPAAAPVASKPFSLSELAGRLALFFIMLFATVEAAGRLGFVGVHELLSTFIAFGGDILLGLVIFVIGYWLADIAAKAIERANPNNAIGLSRIAKFAILGLVVAMGLRAMGVADDIVNLAFGLILGAIAVAVALAFGLGGREAAGRVAARWAERYLQKQQASDGQNPAARSDDNVSQ